MLLAESSAGHLGSPASLAMGATVRRAYIAGIVRRAGVDLMPISAWLLIRLGEDADANLEALTAERGIRPERVQEGLAELCARGLMAAVPALDITPEGCETFTRVSYTGTPQLTCSPIPASSATMAE